MKFIMLFLIIIGCGDTKFKRVEELKGFRILGIVASSPEVAPNGSSNLQLIVSDPEGNGRIVTGEAESCIDPGISLGASVSCDHDPATVRQSYSINFQNDADLGASDLYTGLASDSISVTVPASIFVGRSSREQSNGVGYITIFTFTVDGKMVTAFKRINATNRAGADLNVNPVITGVSLNGGALLSKPSKNDKLRVVTDVAQNYDYINVDGSTEVKAEERAVAWYVSIGKLDKPKAEVNEEVKYLSDQSVETMLVLTLVRDDRGGIVFSKNVLALP